MLARRKPPKSGIQRAPKREWPRHEKWVRGFNCCLVMRAVECSGKIECCHVRTGTGGGTSLKPPSWFTVPMCQMHHTEQHAVGEAQFERKHGINLYVIALHLARMSPDRKMREAMREAGLS